MGRIKSKLVKKTTKKLLVETPEVFNSDFEHNKKILSGVITNKRTRNAIAGYLARIKKKK
ncbi:MAG: 30S ribosomal protein S17e [archaeon]